MQVLSTGYTFCRESLENRIIAINNLYDNQRFRQIIQTDLHQPYE